MSDETLLEQRLSYLAFEEIDRELLSDIEPLLEKHADSFVAAFYRHLLSFEPTRRLLSDPRVKDRLLAKQRAYLISLAHPECDEEFAAERRRIGETHERIGLEPKWYLGAYALYFGLLAPIISAEYPDEPERSARTLAALQKLLMFDAQLAMESYIDFQHRELEYMNRELEQEGRRLGRDFADQGVELQATRERAQTAEQLASIATLIAGLAHEIGTPMGVIQGHAKLLESAVADEDARWRLETIQTQVGRISRIIKTLLNMARPHASKQMPVELGPLIETTLSFLTEKLRRRAIEVESNVVEPATLIGDPERIQQLLLNLCLNATDAMPDGGVLRLAASSLEDGTIELRVADSGAGIREADLSRIFEPFFTTKAAGEGNGLGLMVAKGIVTDHGGSIEVLSGEGEGTEFRMIFPPAG
jgi:signal transduction histidine kinase